MIELRFSITGNVIPVDHGYALYSAVSRIVPELHQANGIAVQTIRGQQIGNRQLLITDHSQLAIRVNSEKIPLFLRLSGRLLDLDGDRIRVGIPNVVPLRPASALGSRLVTIKCDYGRYGPLKPESFSDAVRRQLNTLNLSKNASFLVGKRRTLRIKDKQIIGFQTTLSGLSTSESIAVQELGIGGRRHMGCGIFVPEKERNNKRQTSHTEGGVACHD